MNHKLIYISNDELTKKLFVSELKKENSITFMGAYNEKVKLDRYIRLYNPSIVMLDVSNDATQEMLLLCTTIRNTSETTNLVLLVEDFNKFPSILALRAGATMIIDKKLSACSIVGALKQLTYHSPIPLKHASVMAKTSINLLKMVKMRVFWRKLRYFIDFYAPKGYNYSKNSAVRKHFIKKKNKKKGGISLRDEYKYLKNEGFMPKNDSDLTFLPYSKIKTGEKQ